MALLLVCVSLLTGARLGGALASGSGLRHAALRVSPPASFPSVARWVDVKDGTSYTVRLQSPSGAINGLEARSGFLFTFTTPTGDQLAAGLPITKAADGSFAQSTPLDAQGAPTCAEGSLRLSANGGGAEPVVYTLVARFDQYALVAYAHLVYALADDKAGIVAVCSNSTAQGSTEQALDMFSGCTASDCVSPVDTAGPAVTAFESSVVSAARRGTAQAWQQVYPGVSRVMSAQYSSERFGAVIAGQTQRQGRITSITPANTSPQVQFDAAGQAYFTVTDAVALDKGGGNTTTVTVTSYYLLESGQWVFWFSMPVGS
ncbi:MAG TPA: hypothetical protein VF808_06935 [Ktedonobacterales bacterium]